MIYLIIINIRTDSIQESSLFISNIIKKMFLFKGLLVDKLKSSLKDYLFVFDNNNIDTSFLLGQTTLTNVLVKPDKINEIFRE